MEVNKQEVECCIWHVQDVLNFIHFDFTATRENNSLRIITSLKKTQKTRYHGPRNITYDVFLFLPDTPSFEPESEQPS